MGFFIPLPLRLFDLIGNRAWVVVHLTAQDLQSVRECSLFFMSLRFFQFASEKVSKYFTLSSNFLTFQVLNLLRSAGSFFTNCSYLISKAFSLVSLKFSLNTLYCSVWRRARKLRLVSLGFYYYLIRKYSAHSVIYLLLQLSQTHKLLAGLKKAPDIEAKSIVVDTRIYYLNSLQKFISPFTFKLPAHSIRHAQWFYISMLYWQNISLVSAKI